MAKLGFLGLGIMGAAMARNLLEAGHELMVWNRTPDKCAPLVSLGARQGQTPQKVVEQSEITLAMLADPAAATEVCFGSSGVLNGIKPGKGYIDMSTVDDRTARDISEAVHLAGGRYLEAPVSGTKKPAEDGTLIILTAGDQDLFKVAAPFFDIMGKKTVYLPTIGQAARLKLVINMIMGGMMAALCEGMALGQKGGLEGSTILEVLEAGAMASPMVSGKGPLLLEESFPTSFPLKHMQKDMRLAIALGDQLQLPLPCSASANETFKRACSAGLADADFSAVFKAVK